MEGFCAPFGRRVGEYVWSINKFQGDNFPPDNFPGRQASKKDKFQGDNFPPDKFQIGQLPPDKFTQLCF